MSLLTVSALEKSYGPVDIFTGVSFSLPKRARYAIVGPNGVGKTTLLRIIAGQESATGGQVQLARGISVGYLPQEENTGSGRNQESFRESRTLWEDCLAVFEDLIVMETELKQLTAAMRDPQEAQAVMARYGTLQAAFETRGGYTYETRIRQVLTGLGFTRDDLHHPLAHLSGGQRTRARLGRLLLAGHDLLLLDEPTNHLDIAAVEWLEGFLKDWEGAALIVSHDRYFLDRVATHILEMYRGHMESYRGNYTAYQQQREARWEERQEFFLAEKSRLEKELDYIKRNIAGQNVAQARGKLRRLSRYLKAVEQLGFEGVRGKKWAEIAGKTDIGHTIGVAEAHERIKALQRPTHGSRGLNLHLAPRRRSGRIILRTHDLQVGYPGHPLFEVKDIEFHRLGCAAIIGPNGSGKSSFLKTILGTLAPLRGKLTPGASLDIAYFAQAHEGLNPGHTLIEEIDSVAPRMSPGEIRSYLARFLFRGEEVFKKVAVLSGGERGRLALAKLALTDANLLLLDEPTNHLDIPAQEILQGVLSNFAGTIILVSHDRYLIDALATEVWEIDPDRGDMRVFAGGYQAYRMAKESGELEKQRKKGDGVRREARTNHVRAKNRALAQERSRLKRLAEVETLITILEEKLSALVSKLETPPADSRKVQKLGQEFVQTQDRLEALMDEWGTLHAESGKRLKS